jgi:hypothetical protein
MIKQAVVGSGRRGQSRAGSPGELVKNLRIRMYDKQKTYGDSACYV